jgi:signal transduction histidine kinase
MRLERRLALSLSAFALGVSGLLAAALWWGHAELERRLLDTVLQQQLLRYLDSGYTPPQAADGGPALLRPARNPQAPLPAPLAGLAPGSHRDVALGDSHAHVLVRELAPGDRAYLIYDVQWLEQRERDLLLAFALALAFTALLSVLAARRIARRLLEPLDSVVARIRGLDPGHTTAVAARAEDGEFAIIIDAINALLRELGQLVTRERAFAGAASHELRTPLASARIAAEMLASRPEVPAEPLARVQRAMLAATETLDALLALSRERELPGAQSLALRTWLPRAAEPYAIAAADQQTTLEWRIADVTLQAAPGILEVIFTNLLRNAIRATPAGRIVIDADAGQIVVRDEGEGISAGELAHVFEPGMRGRHGGSGIGLYIARELARRCGWSIGIDSVEGQGTVATLRFGIASSSS